MKRALWFLLLLTQAAMGGELPRPDHVLIVIEENKAFAQIIGNREAPYLNALAKRGVLFTRSYGVTHPSQPNYLALFSGTTHDITSDACPLELGGDNLARALQERGLSFASYAESLPAAGAGDCIYGAYWRKHNPVANWKELTPLNLPFAALPQDFDALPTVALVIPDQRHDMHDGSIAEGDAWLSEHLDRYAQWAMTHNSLLIVTWDEDNGSADNRVATLFLGQVVRPGKSAQRIDHYRVLRTVEDMFGLRHLHNSAHAWPIGGVWRAE